MAILFRIVFLLLVLSVVAACTSKPVVTKRFFWPPLTDKPKVEYIGFYQTDYDVKKGQVGGLEEVLFGREKPSAVFLQPYDVYSDGKGRIYLSEPIGKFVHVVDLGAGTIGNLKKRKVNAPFRMPMGIAGDSRGNIYVIDSKAEKILVFDQEDQLQNEIILNGIDHPVEIAIDEKFNRLYVVSPSEHKVQVLDLISGLEVGNIGGRGIEKGTFNYPLDIDVDLDGNLYVLDSLNARVQVFDSRGAFVRSFGERGTASGSFQIPKGIAISSSGHVYVTDSMAHKVVVFDLEGRHLMTFGGKAPAFDGSVSPGGMYLPQGIDVDSKGRIWIVDTLNRMIHRFQYLTEEYLESHPILPGQAVVPALGR